MAELTANDHVTLDGDANVVVSADPKHAACTSLSAADPLSAPVNNPMVYGA